MPLIISPAFERRLNRLMRLQNNPPRPHELVEVLRAFDAWAGKEAKFLGSNTKTNKTDIGKMFLSSSVKLDKEVTGDNWVVRGVALLPANMLGKAAKADPAKWGMTPGEAAQLSKVNFCSGATAGCMAVCLANAGQMPQVSVRAAQMRRSLAYLRQRPAFMLAVIAGIAGFRSWAVKKDLRPAFRLNITSDLDWEKSTSGSPRVAGRVPAPLP